MTLAASGYRRTWALAAIAALQHLIKVKEALRASDGESGISNLPLVLMMSSMVARSLAASRARTAIAVRIPAINRSTASGTAGQKWRAAMAEVAGETSRRRCELLLVSSTTMADEHVPASRNRAVTQDRPNGRRTDCMNLPAVETSSSV